MYCHSHVLLLCFRSLPINAFVASLWVSIIDSVFIPYSIHVMLQPESIWIIPQHFTTVWEHRPCSYIHTYIYTYIHTYIHTCIHTLHTYIHTYIHRYIDTYCPHRGRRANVRIFLLFFFWTDAFFDMFIGSQHYQDLRQQRSCKIQENHMDPHAAAVHDYVRQWAHKCRRCRWRCDRMPLH